ncbi:MAG: CvpA family protein [Anaerolineae bacterium]
MTSIATWSVNQYVLIAIVASLFGLIGYRRGIRRELIVLLTLVVAIAAVGFITDSLVEPLNRFYYLQKFARVGGLGADDPSAVWREVRGAPELIESERSRDVLKIGLFGGVALLAYILSARYGRARVGVVDGVLGLLVGLLNGVAVIYFLLPILFPDPTTLLEISTARVQGTLGGGMLRVQLFIVFVVVLIAYGLYSASGRYGGQG